MDQLEFGTIAKPRLYRWQWHGRQCFTEVRNDFRFNRRTHRVVYRLDDFCSAATESEARLKFKAEYPYAQELGLVRLCEVLE